MSNKTLHIDTDDQIPNRILKDDTNKVKQITDKAQNIAFTQSDSAKQPVYNHDGYYNANNSGNGGLYFPTNNIEVGTSDYFIHFKGRVNTGCDRLAFLIAYDGGNVSGLNFQYAGGTLSILQYNMSNNPEVIAALNIVNNGWLDKQFEILIEKRGTKANFYASVENSFDFQFIQQYTVSSEVFFDQNIKTSIMADIWGNRVANADLFHLTISLGQYGYFDKYNTLSTIIPYNYKPFNYYHRYKDDGNKKLYLSSKYLKDAVIDASNEITSIKDALYSYDFNYVVAKMKLKNGFYAETGNESLTTPLNEITGDIGTKDLYFGSWIRFDDLGTQVNAVTLSGTLTIGKYNTNKVFIYAQGYMSPDYTITVGDWVYISYVRKGAYQYVIINGIAVFITTATLKDWGTNNWVRLNYSTTGVHASDDILLITDPLIDPTGYSIGHKVFEPPRRGGFDSIIKQY